MRRISRIGLDSGPTECYNHSRDAVPPRRGGRVVDGTALEKRQVMSFVGSNPSLSAQSAWSTCDTGDELDAG